MIDGPVRRPKRETTLASSITAELRRDIISGGLAPGEKIRLREVAQRFGVGMSPVREALNRLSRDRLVHQSDLRGFRVAPISEVELEELMRARCWLNEIGLRESIARGDVAWEESVILAYHRMSRLPRRLVPTDHAVNPEWEEAHRAFHRSLIQGCGSRWIVDFCDQLFDVADIYRSVARAVPEALAREPEDEHGFIMQAVIARNAEKAVSLLNNHIQRTVTLYKRAVETVRKEAESADRA